MDATLHSGLFNLQVKFSNSAERKNVMSQIFVVWNSERFMKIWYYIWVPLYLAFFWLAVELDLNMYLELCSETESREESKEIRVEGGQANPF